jgi:hypothetical protein
MPGRSNPDVDAAVAAYRQALSNDPKNTPNQQEFARSHGIKPPTFCRRLNGINKPRTLSHISRQALTPPEEAELVDLIRRFTLLGHPLPYKTVRDVANQLHRTRLIHDGMKAEDITPLGQNWFQRLKRRHECLHHVWTKRIEKARKRATLNEKLETWFDELEQVRWVGGHLKENIWNMDETGYGVGAGASHQCLVALDSSERDAIDDARRVGGAGKQGQEWVTTIDCVSAVGKEIAPVVILPGNVDYDPRNRPDDPRARLWAFESTQSGWTNNTIGLKWLMKRFLPFSRPYDQSQRRLLIVDGHSSHVRADFIAGCMREKVDLLILPAHSSHKTQPLDVGVFHTVKHRLSYLTDHHHRYSTRDRIPRRRWLQLLLDARSEGITAANIKTGFRKTGIEPFDRTIIERDTLPAPSPPPPVGPDAPSPTARLTQTVLSELDPNMMPERRRHIEDLALMAEQLAARNIVLEGELAKYQEVNQEPSRAGATVAHLETHVFSQPRVLETIRGRKEVVEKRKAKKLARDNAKMLQNLQASVAGSQASSHAGPSTIRGL